MQKEGQNNIYKVLEEYIPKGVLSNKNRAKSWKYGYDDTYDLIVISRDGTLGEVVEIQNLKIGLPLAPN